MRNLKKFLALVLSVMMVLSLAVTASATSINDGKDQVFNDNSAIESKFVKAVEVLNGMDVLKGDADTSGNTTGNFRPADTITRAEVAAMVFRLATGLTGSTDANHFAQYGNFSDVRDDAWYAGYVGYCANAKYVKGYAGEYGPFGPSDNVTGYQALAMILRAVGYGVNGEFDGASWQVEVAAISEQTGILKNINTTSFGGATLQQPARRDVVAEIFFQAAQLDRVVYTPAFGYQTTNVQNNTVGQTHTRGQTSLGYINFGLTKTERIVVGNQATGEKSTRLGSDGNYWWDTTIDGTATRVVQRPYDYPGTRLALDDAGKIYTAGNGLDIDLVSGIDLFGHKVEVWYNAKTNGTVKQTYAYYDEAELVKMVYANNPSTAHYQYEAPEDDKVVGLGNTAISNGFSFAATDVLYVSDRYGQMYTAPNDGEYNESAAPFAPALPNGDAASTEDVGNGDVLPYGLAAANGSGDENGGFYMLISNSSDKNLDVVITLAPELARIYKQDTTASTHTLTLNGKINNANDKPSTFGQADDGTIRLNSVTESSTKTLGDLVTAWEIKGTAYTQNRTATDYVSNNSNQYFYQLNKIEKTYTGVVSTYIPTTGKVTLTDGKVLDFTLLPIINEAVLKPDANNSETYFYNGVEYTFYLDEMGRYVRAEQASGYQFLYATFGDYEIGGLGTGTIKYAVTGVNWNGEKQINQITETIDGVAIDGVNYEPLEIVKKNLGTGKNDINPIIGNELQPGQYTGYAYNAGSKDLGVTVAPDDGTERDRRDPHSYYDGKVAPDTVWSIDKSHVSNGWYDAHQDGREVGSLLLTPNTRFILVEGTGSATLNVDIRDGIGALLGTADSVTIDTQFEADFNRDGDLEDHDYNMYYLLADDTYNNIDTNWGDRYDNHMVQTIILPKEAVTWSNSSTLYFTTNVNPTGTGTLLADTTTDSQIYQFVMYKNGVRDTYFVDVTLGSGAPVAADAKIGEFFNLTEVRKLNGTPIYRADSLSQPVEDDYYTTQNARTICNIDYTYDYFAVNNTSTARLTNNNNPSSQQVYNVSNATVVNVSNNGTITNVRELNNAVSVGYTVRVAIVNSGLNISMIYVTEVVAP